MPLKRSDTERLCAHDLQHRQELKHAPCPSVLRYSNRRTSPEAPSPGRCAGLRFRTSQMKGLPCQRTFPERQTVWFQALRFSRTVLQFRLRCCPQLAQLLQSRSAPAVPVKVTSRWSCPHPSRQSLRMHGCTEDLHAHPGKTDTHGLCNSCTAPGMLLAAPSKTRSRSRCPRPL